MIFDNNSLAELRARIKGRLSEKRYQHTLGVENLAKHLGEILLPERVDELCVAALLHDAAKEMTYEEHLELLKESFVEYTDEDLLIKPALHSIAAVPLIKTEFSEYATPDVCSAVYNHTLGAPNMSVFDEIIFISDYAEEGRTYRTCVEVRKYLFDNIRKENSNSDNINSLHKASLKSIVSTIDSITNRNQMIHSETLLTKTYLEDVILK